MMIWQPIRTAIEDERLVLLGAWEHEDENLPAQWIVRQGWRDGGLNPAWYDIDNEQIYPTHWMECPTPPTYDPPKQMTEEELLAGLEGLLPPHC